MLVNVIKEIRGTEEKANEIRRRGYFQARKLVQDAETKAAELVSQSVVAAEAESREMLAQADQEIKKLVAPLHEEAEQEITRLQEEKQRNQEQAITMVMERIVKSCGHS